MYICALHRAVSNSHVEGRVDLYRDTSTEDVWGHNTVHRPLVSVFLRVTPDSFPIVNKKGVSEKPKGLAARGCEQ